MDKVRLYLELVPIEVVVIAPILGIIAFVMVPTRVRLDVAIAACIIWLTLGELVSLGVVQAAAKTTGFAAYLMVFVAALLDPRPKRQVPPMAWLYILTAAQAFIYIWTVSNFVQALAIRVQWMLLCVAAMAVACTIVDERSLKRVIRALSVGFALAVLLPLSELVVNPSTAFTANGRFNPYDANPNHIGVVFALTPGFALYAAMYARTRFRKWVWILAAIAAVGCGLITASRSTMVVMVGVCLPLAMAYFKRPGMVIAGAAVLVAAMAVAFTFADRVNFERYGLEATLSSGRVEHLADHPYFPIIAQRPLFGLLETHGESFLRADSEMYGHPHNAYWELLYFGGFTYGLPMFFLAGYTFWCLWVTWRERRRLIGADPLLVQLLMALMVMTYAHGFVNHALHYPTTTLSVMHVLLSVFFIGLASDLQRGEPVLEAEEPADLEALEGLYDDYGSEVQAA